MPAPDSPDFLVARYLKTGGFAKTLSAFLEETGIEESQITGECKYTLEDLLEEKRIYDLSLKLETILAIEKKEEEFSLPYPSTPHLLRPSSTSSTSTPTPSNYIHTAITHFPRPYNRQLILATTVSSQIHLFDPTPNATTTTAAISSLSPTPTTYPLLKTLPPLHTSPTLTTYPLRNGKYLLTGSMDGTTYLHKTANPEYKRLWSAAKHEKFVVKVIVSRDERWIVTASYDKRVNIYYVNTLPAGGSDDEEEEGEDEGAEEQGEGTQADNCKEEEEEGDIDITLVHTIELQSTPEGMCFVPHTPPPIPQPTLATDSLSAPPRQPQRPQPQPHPQPQTLILARRDSTLLTYYTLTPPSPTSSPTSTSPTSPTITLSHTYTLTPESSHSSISFTPMALSPHPKNPRHLAILTDTVPIMKFLLMETYTGKILVECFTGAAQSPYSTAALSWRPDGTGVWVNSDDGVVRGIEARSGKVVAVLGGGGGGGGLGHTGKVRTLWGGLVYGMRGEAREVLVTGGFDQKLIIWEV
ncbi:WD40-repeat-containing domain protein [Peziza echinospora]|nr:WD40-repeat-containing domain protein [Peziza echinospora]